MKCPKCNARDWPDDCQQAECIRRFGECIACRFTGFGTGTTDEFDDLTKWEPGRREVDLPKDCDMELTRANVAAYTEVGTPSYPAFVSINREKDGFYSIAVRTRGHDGNQMATIDKMSRNAIRALAWDILEGDDTLFRDELKKMVQKGV